MTTLIASERLCTPNVDLNFYAHELREMELMKQGVGYTDAHRRALKDYGIEYKKGYEAQLYTKEAYDAGEAWFQNEAKFKKK